MREAEGRNHVDLDLARRCVTCCEGRPMAYPKRSMFRRGRGERMAFSKSVRLPMCDPMKIPSRVLKALKKRSVRNRGLRYPSASE
jgi:hypothetical protein